MDDILTNIEELMDYVRSRRNIDREEVGFMYNRIRDQILRELKFSELSMVRLMTILLELYRTDRDMFEYALVFLSRPLQSMTSVGDRFGVSESTAYRRIRRLGTLHPEFGLLLELRRFEAGKNRKYKHEAIFSGQGKSMTPKNRPSAKV